MCQQDSLFPFTHVVDVRQAMESLDYCEMVSLAEIFGQWAFNEEGLDDDRRTQLVQWSADYERIAVFVGERWRATASDDPVSLIQFVARNAFAEKPTVHRE